MHAVGMNGPWNTRETVSQIIIVGGIFLISLPHTVRGKFFVYGLKRSKIFKNLTISKLVILILCIKDVVGANKSIRVILVVYIILFGA